MTETPAGNGESTISGASGILGVNALQKAIDSFDKTVTTLAGIVGTLKGGAASYQQGQNTFGSWNQFSNWMTGSSSNGGNPTFGGTPFNPNTGSSNGGGPTFINGTPGMSGGAHAMPGPASVGGLGSIFSSGGGQHAAPSNGMGRAMFVASAGMSAASAIHAATGMSSAGYQTTAQTMASTAQVMSTGQSVNAPALFKNGGQYAFNGIDQASAAMGVFQNSGYAPNTGGFKSYMNFVGQQGMANPMMSAQQAQQSVSGFYSPSGIVGLHQVGITTVQRGGQRMSPINIANQILAQIDPQGTVRTAAQTAQLVNDPNSPLNLTMGNWVSSGLMDGSMAQQVRDQITMILKARQNGVNPTQLQNLVNAASNGSSSAASTLKGMQIGNSAIQSVKTLDQAKRGNMEQGLTGFEQGLSASTSALTKFTNVLNAIEEDTGFSFLSGLFKGGTSQGKFGGGLTVAGMGFGGLANLIPGGGALSGFGGEVSHLMGSLPGIGGNNDSRMSTNSQAGGGGVAPNVPIGSAGGSSSSGKGGSTHMIWPVGHAPITEPYGVKSSQYAAGHHTGVDFGVPIGTPVHAAASGTVVNAGPGGAYGTYLVVDLHNGLWTLYAHLSRIAVGMGAQVRQGQVIAYSGDTGNSTGPHLHFEVRKGANRYGMDVNPMPYLGGASMPTPTGGSSGSSNAGGTTGGSSGSAGSAALGTGASYMMSSGGGGSQAYGAGMSELDVLGSAPSASGASMTMMMPMTGTGMPGSSSGSPQPGGSSYVGGVGSSTPGSTASGGTPSAGGNRGLGMQLASKYGWGTGAEWNALNMLWTRESGWSTTATNPHSGAYGIAQALPASKYGTVAPDWRTNPATQIEWGLMYIKNRYGDPLHAWGHEEADNWYAKGAWDLPSDQTARVHKGEMILPAQSARQIREILINGNPYKAMGNQGGGGVSIVFEKDSIHLTVKGDNGGTTSSAGRALAKEFVDTLTLDRRIRALQGGV